MFQYIRSFFRDLFFEKDEFPSTVWHNGQKYIVHEWPNLPDGFTNKTESLTQAELQMLQRIVADAINLEEEYRNLDKMDAQSWVKGSAERDIFFKSVKKRSMKIKKLSALQYRLKHKIAARG